MKSLGICTQHKSLSKLNHEKRSIYGEGKKVFDKVLLIDTRSVTYHLIRGKQQPIIVHDGEDISNLSVLHVRSTKNREASTAILVHSLSLCGCLISDPLDRFSVGFASKLLTELRRFESGIGIDSYFMFNFENAITLLKNLDSQKAFPLLTKPIAGKFGRGVELIENVNSGISYTEHFFSRTKEKDVPLFLQRFIEFQNEYRVLVIDGVALGIVKKEPSPGSITANAARGAKFIKVNRPDIVRYTVENVSKEGILGVDIAEGSDKKLYIVETNRAPLWENFELATGINVAKQIIKQSLNGWIDNIN